MKYTVICKGSAHNGLGHLHRALSFIAGAREEASFNLVAIIEPGLESLFRRHPEAVLIYRDADLSAALNSLQHEADCCIIDMLDIEEHQRKFLRGRYRRIYSLSPVFSDYGIIDGLFTRFDKYNYPSHVRVFGGLEYTVISTHSRTISDAEFEHNLGDEYLTLAVSMGGADAANVTLKVLQAIAGVKQDLTIWVFLGEGYSHSYQELVDAVKKDSYHEIILVKSNRSMWKIISHCSLAIFAGGLTFMEAVYAGLPTINILERESQNQLISGRIRKQNVSVFLGPLTDATGSHLCNTLEDFYANRDKLRLMRRNTKGLVDKDGPLRIIRGIKCDASG